MAGTKEGGIKAREKNLAKDPDFYKKIGTQGGKSSSPTKGFGFDYRTRVEKILRRPTYAMLCGRKGGSISKRGSHEAR